MNTKYLKILNPILLVSFLVQACTGMYLSLVRLNETLGDIHEANAYLLLALFILHIVFNFNWIKSTYFSRRQPSK